PPPSATTAIDLDGLPAGAQVIVDGAPSATPHLEFARGSTHTIRVTAPGKQPYETRVVADRDRSIVVALADVPPPAVVVPAPAITAAADPNAAHPTVAHHGAAAAPPAGAHGAQHG